MQKVETLTKLKNIRSLLNATPCYTGRFLFGAGLNKAFIKACGPCSNNTTDQDNKTRADKALSSARATVQELREYFQQNNYRLAEICLDLLMEKKILKDADIDPSTLSAYDLEEIRQGYMPKSLLDQGKTIPLRKNKINPEFVHEVKEADVAHSLIRSGLVPKNSSDLGPAELLICATLVHDLGEDFNTLRSDLVEKLTDRYNEKYPKEFNAKEQEYVEEIGDIMERLTHDREYKCSEIQDLVGDDIPIPTKGEILEKGFIALPELTAHLAKTQMGDVKGRLGLDGFKAFAVIKKGKPIIVTTRFSAERDGQTIVDWHQYIQNLIKSPYAFLAKMIDRTEGLSTRIGIKPFDLKDFRAYLRKTYALFGVNEIVRKKEDPAYKKLAPLAEAFDSVDKMMSIPYKIGVAFSDHHPEENDNGGFKDLAAENMPAINFQGVTPLALRGQRFVQPDNHTIKTMMEELRNTFPRLEKYGYRQLYNTIKRDLIQDAKWWNIEALIDNEPKPETGPEQIPA